MAVSFDTEIQFLKGIGEKRAALLHKLGIDGAIAGKAVYTGSLDLAAAIRAVED